MFSFNKYLYIGLAFALPFFVLNFFVATGAPVVSFLRSLSASGYEEQYLILGLIVLVFVGGVVSLYPVIKERRILILNMLLAVLLIGFSCAAGYGLAEDFYNCNVLQIPNCD